MSASDILHRFNEYGVQGLFKQPNNKLGKRPVNQQVVNRILRMVKIESPSDAREIVKSISCSYTMVHQILQAH